MATYYSDHFSGVNPDTGAEDNSVLSKTKYPPDGIGGGRLRYARAEITVDAADSDEFRMMQLRSGDRIVAMFLTHTDSGDAGNLQFGFSKSGVKHDGASLEPNVLSGNIFLTTAASHTETLGIGGGADGAGSAMLDRGKTLWQTLEGGGPMPDGDYSVDPGEDWDLVIFVHTGTTVATQIIIEVLYTSEG